MPINSKKKGSRGELAWAKLCREYGFDCRRTAQYCGNTGEAADVVGIPGIHQEVKWVESLNLRKAMEQAENDCGENVPIVAHKKNGKEWLVTMRAVDWLEMVKYIKNKKDQKETIFYNSPYPIGCDTNTEYAYTISRKYNIPIESVTQEMIDRTRRNKNIGW